MITIIGHKNPDVDSVISGILLEKIMKLNNREAEFVIPDKYLDEDTYQLLKKYNIDMKKYQKNIQEDTQLFLVDHSKTHIKGEIIGIIDHHNTILKKTPPFYINEDTSSTAMIIYKEAKEFMNEEDMHLVVLANLVDTASFHSTKTKKEDIALTKQIIDKYGFDFNKLYNDGLCLTPLNNLRNAAFNGYKKEDRIASSYVQLYEKHFDEIKIMTNILKRELIVDEIDMYVFMIHDMKQLQTKALFIKKEHIKEKQFDKYTSRKEAFEYYFKNREEKFLGNI